MERADARACADLDRGGYLTCIPDGFITSEGLFPAKLCAAAMVVSLPLLIAGFAAQDKLVQGLSLGAVK